ncbi:molybdopterin cofactor-binding domain-containing protein [Variovorax sp. Sphag1AA]|uniref:xanthine dehydrogenase family protein molybdopterin-binding subunit n=1 Tax=Variovorax sp. Sphag1AA TaxID=2587027 RepID=UPI0016077F7E|nr:molybdopterin cofactor-binding domain-containing protein [Variovorax sp. Sphag1AA]MBB3178767.1 isoquinoline 1-oxidoreductase beta subunit [Variovorax sp. Sphag1AA]
MAFEIFKCPANDVGPASASRRALLQTGGAVAAGLAIGVNLLQEFAAAASASSFAPNAFVQIESDDRITLTMAKIEMGQGTYTSIAMLIAEELEVNPERIVLRHAPADVKAYGAPFGDQFTGGSTSIRTLHEPMRQAGAAARILLVNAAAQTWNVAASTCRAERGEVIHGPSGRRLRYGALAARASRLPMPKDIPLKPASEFKVIGKAVKRLDAKGKTDGTALFGIDAVVPGMKFASIVVSPVIGGRVKSVNDGKAKALPGVVDVVKIDDAVAVIAENTWYAQRGTQALEIVWDEGPNAHLSTDDLHQLMSLALGRPGVVARNDGDALKVIAADPARVSSNYSNPMLAHATMEPANCTVHVRADGADIWVGTQVPARARDRAAQLLGLPPEKVTLHNFLLGGGFGRRLYHDYVDQAVLIARQVNYPVKVVWPREQDIQREPHRGHYAHTITASLNAEGLPVAISHKTSGPSNLGVFAPAWIKPDGVDIDAADGAVTFPYDVPNVRTEFVREDGPIPSGFWRGVGPTRNLLAIESFMDELAHRAGKDPLAYRLALLSRDERSRHVLQRTAEISRWGEPLAPRRGKGIALLYAWDTVLAQAVDLSVESDGTIKVNKVSCVVDCGTVVNPDTVVAQIQGGINFGLTAALYGEIVVKDGRVQQSNFHDYRMLRMSEAPQIDVEVVRSAEKPGGIGEPGTAGLGPAFVNAIFAATGKRVYALPVKPASLAA